MDRGLTILVIGALLMCIRAGAQLPPIHEAALRGELAVVKAMLKADPHLLNQPTEVGMTPLHWAACSDSPELVEFLLKKGAELDRLDRSENTPLHRAIERGTFKSADVLIQSGARRDLFIDVGLGDIDRVRSLLRDDPQAVHRVDGLKRPALYWALIRDRLEMAEVLVEHGAEVNQRCYEKPPQGLLWVTARLGNERMLAFLLGHGAGAVEGDFNSN